MFFNILCGLRIIWFRDIIEVLKRGNTIESINLKINNMETVNFKETPGGFKCTIINTDKLIVPKKNELKYTKGEWIISDKIEQDIFRYTSIKCVDTEICSVKGTWTEEGKANANLLRSAPDLYEALCLLYDSLPDGYTSACLPIVRKAIQRASALSF